jgi:XTP/dITP diphosphohydrolase
VSVPARLAIASRNEHKLREIERICAGWDVEWLTVANHDGPWPDVDEPYETYLENAVAKAQETAVALGVPAVADDSGIEVDALGGAPGPRSARFAGERATDVENLEALLAAIDDAADRLARYRCVAAVAWPDGRPAVWAEGTCEGAVIAERRGDNGFGYDPAFVPQGEARTMAELADEEKDRISHRGRALRELHERLVRA